MRTYSLKQVPNQRFSLIPERSVYDFSLRFFRGLLYVTVRNGSGAVYVGSLRCADRQWLLPWRRPGYGDGNFRFEDDDNQYPDYRNFGTTCRLVFYPYAETEEMQ